MNQIINNSLIGLNKVGTAFCGYAANVFVQSALLVIVLFAVDLLLRKRVRAIFRYCLWMLVLVKLVLPPMLSLPTGIGYWVGDRLPVGLAAPRKAFDLVGPEGISPRAEITQVRPAENIAGDDPAMAPAESALTPLTWQAVLFLLWLAGVLAFLAVLIQRIRFVKGLAAASCPAGDELTGLLEQCRRQMAVRRDIRLRISEAVPSPAVCGLLRPTVLMPTSLVEKLSPEGLRATLIHELAHMKRGDLWVNSMQTFLQVVYFYNPFVWFANSMIRKVCEEAVDETVLVALGGQAKDYSNTLIDIGEMVFWKADLGLRLIGVAESRKALQWRIKHMLNRPIPKTSKLGAIGIAAVVAIAAVLLPMARAEKRAEENKPVTVKNEEKPSKSIHEASAAGDIDQVKTLLGQGVDINSKDDGGLTPLHHAIREGHTELARFLIDRGADLEAKEKRWDYAPLLYAIWFNNTDIVEVLVNKGVDVNYTPKRDYSPLINAIWSKDECRYNMAKLLVDHGARFDVKDNDGWTAFRHAAEAGYHDLVELFVAKGADISTFHMVACMGDLDRVKNFVQRGADVNIMDELGWAPLFWAACMGRTEVVQYLIAQGADVNSKTSNQSTALHRAANAGAKNLIQLLIAKGADVNARNRRGRTPLHEASNKEVAELLILKGADVNVRDLGTMTPLWRAASNGRTEVVEILIANGADINTNDFQGRTALLQAKQRGHTEVVELLQQHGVKESLHDAAASGDIGEVKRFIEQGADVNTKIQYGITPLLATSELPIVEFLISKGAQIDSRNQGGRTLLHLACRNGYKDVAEFLIRKGADVNLRDRGGMTPLWLAAGHREVEIAEILIANGADVTAKDNQGRTPLDRATAWWAQCDQMVDLLKKHGAKE